MTHTSGGSKGGRQGRPPPGSEFFHLHAVFGRKNRSAHPLWELAPPPPEENPGSATAYIQAGGQLTRAWEILDLVLIIYPSDLLCVILWLLKWSVSDLILTKNAAENVEK